MITCRKWSVHCLGHTNTCNNRKVFTCTWTFSLPPLLSHWVQGVGGSLSGPVPDQGGCWDFKKNSDQGGWRGLTNIMHCIFKMISSSQLNKNCHQAYTVMIIVPTLDIVHCSYFISQTKHSWSQGLHICQNSHSITMKRNVHQDCW